MDIDCGAEFGKGLVFEAKDSCKNVESSLISDKDRVKDETLRERMEGKVVSARGVEFTNNNESLEYQDFNASGCFKMVTCDGLENQALEVNVEEESNRNELTPMRVSVSTECEVDLLSVADFIRYSRMDGNVSSGVNGKSCSSKLEFEVSDLVWGKVRTHPWWPGQICDPSAASELAKKCFKRGSYLIAYFGDQTFAWNEAPKIKPFLEHCSKMEKQSDMEEFQKAVDCALDEVSRRVEFGLACSCIFKREYARLKTQKIINAGIRKEAASRRDGGDSSLSAAFFEPAKVIKFIKKLAQLPYGKADRLELVTSLAQLSAFWRWKSYGPLPEENDTDNFLLGEKNHCNEVSDEALSVVEIEKLVQKSESEDNSLRECKDISDSKAQKCLFPMSENESEGKAGSEFILQPCNKRKGLDAIADEDVLPVIKDGKLVWKLETKDNSLHKYRHISGDSMNLSEEEQSLSDLEGMKCLSTPMSENGLEEKGDGKLISQPSVKKRKEVDAMADDAAVKHRKSDSSQGIGSNANYQSFEVEDFFNLFLQQS
ncbi:PWWP domain-containing protein 5-like [Rosa sericea]